MAQPVWVLSVDLQAKTATFQTGLAEAAKSARGSFQDIRGGAGEMGGGVGYSMMEARHSVMLLGEEFGIHLPRAVAGFIASIGPLGEALEAAFPFLAIAVGATILLEHLAAMREAGEKLTQDQLNFGTACQNSFNMLQDKLIESQIKTDELRNDHLGALKLQLQLIDHQSMNELVHSLEEVSKSADVVMKDLAGHWYTFGIGSDGASHALEEFKNKYDALMSKQTDSSKAEAGNLLAGTLKTAQEVLKAQQTIKANRDSNDGQTDDSVAAENVLRAHKASLTVTENELKAQEAIVGALQQQVDNAAEIDKNRQNTGNNTKTEEAQREAAQRATAAKQAADSQARMGELAIAADKATAESSLAVHRASLEERLSVDLDFAARERDVKQAANAQEIAGLDKSGKDYANQLQALNEKALEIGAAYETQVAELKAKSSVESYNRDIQVLEESEREKIGVEQAGSTARLAAIDASIKEEESKHLQFSSFFRDLLSQRREEVLKETEEEGKLRDAAIKQDISARQTASQEQTRHSAAMSKIEKPRGSDDFSAKADEINREYAAKHEELLKELADTQTMGTQKVAEQRRINAEIEALDRKHQDEMTENAAGQAQAEKSAAMDVANSWGQSMLRVAEGHESMAKVAKGAFDSVVSNSLRAALMSIAHEKTTQLAHAESAAAGAYGAMSNIPVIGPALGAVAAAAVFAGAMAFEGGTDSVPGVGRGDIVPSMLTPGEGIVPGGVMDGLRTVARNGGFEQRPSTAVHVQTTYHVNTIDGDGMSKTLEKHADQLEQHVNRAVRRMNR